MIPRAIAATLARSEEKVARAASRAPAAEAAGAPPPAGEPPPPPPTGGRAARRPGIAQDGVTADEPVDPHAHVLKEQLASGRRVQAHLAQRGRLLEPRHPPVEDERQDPALPQRRLAVVQLADEHGGVGVRAVGDE